MKSNIAAEYYYKKEIFSDERISIFHKNWVFVGFASQLANPDDFITRRIGEVPVLVQNIKGEVRAFLNVCSHRFSILQQQECGNRPLVCPYHGWAYDQRGVPTGIPKKPLFKDFTNEELHEMKLKQYKIEFCGNLCFVSLDKNSSSLKEYLGEFFDEVCVMSTSLGKMADVNTMEINANWKIIIENTLESYHVGSIHSKTFKKLGASGLEFEFTPYHSCWNAQLTVMRADPANRLLENLFSTREYKIDGYKHFFIFPNLLISSTHGTSYNYSLIEPVSPDLTRFNSYVFTARPVSEEKKALLDAFEKSLVEFNREVFAEDKAICQLVQKGVYHTAQTGVLSLEEDRVHAFQNKYIGLVT